MAWSFEAKIIETIFNALEAVICSTAVYFLYADKVKESDILGKYSCYIWILIFSYLYTIRNMMTMVLIAHLKHISTLSCRSALEYDHCYSQSHLNQSDFRFTSLSNTRCSLSLSYEWNEKKISFRQVIDIMFFFIPCCCWTDMWWDACFLYLVVFASMTLYYQNQWTIHRFLLWFQNV